MTIKPKLSVIDVIEEHNFYQKWKVRNKVVFVKF
jgi:hypothetical protein